MPALVDGPRSRLWCSSPETGRNTDCRSSIRLGLRGLGRIDGAAPDARRAASVWPLTLPRITSTELYQASYIPYSAQQISADHQYEDRQGTRPHFVANAARTRQRGDRIEMPFAAVRRSRLAHCVGCRSQSNVGFRGRKRKWPSAAADCAGCELARKGSRCFELAVVHNALANGSLLGREGLSTNEATGFCHADRCDCCMATNSSRAATIVAFDWRPQQRTCQIA